MKCIKTNDPSDICTRVWGERIKKIILAIVLILAVFTNAAMTSTIAGTSWNQSTVRYLRSVNEADIAQFINDDTTYSAVALSERDIGEVAWRNLEGDNRYQLLVTVDVNDRQLFNALLIFWRDYNGKISYQTIHFDGWGIKDLESAIKDLNGDGKDELIIPTLLISYSTADTFTWPAVYRLEGKRYVEASNEFGSYYEKEIIPGLEKEIGDPQLAPVGALNRDETKAVLTMERAQILRVIGRDPSAGLADAYQWMNSGDPRLLQDSAAVLQKIGGHPKELVTARESYERALAAERTAVH